MAAMGNTCFWLIEIKKKTYPRNEKLIFFSFKFNQIDTRINPKSEQKKLIRLLMAKLNNLTREFVEINILVHRRSSTNLPFFLADQTSNMVDMGKVCFWLVKIRKISPLKLQGQMKYNLVGIMCEKWRAWKLSYNNFAKKRHRFSPEYFWCI
jgi:hypothetical protein